MRGGVRGIVTATAQNLESLGGSVTFCGVGLDTLRCAGIGLDETKWGSRGIPR